MRASCVLPLGAALAVAAACGPATPTPAEAPSARASSEPGPPAPPVGSAASARTSEASPPTSGAPPDASKPALAHVPMKPIAASAMANDLRETGIDPQALPPLNKLPPDKLRSVMKTFTRALGVPCSHCHDTGDFRAPTVNKKIATRMWNDFSRALTMDGTTVYCDSCHAGRAKVLDRTDLEALGHWMDENYVGALKRTDGKDQGCDSCHGEPFEGKILSKLWK